MNNVAFNGCYDVLIIISFYLFFFLQIGISVFKILIQVTRPNTILKGIIPGSQSYRSLGQYKEALRVPHFLILGIESPIYFANSTYLQERYIFLALVISFAHTKRLFHLKFIKSILILIYTNFIPCIILNAGF